MKVTTSITDLNHWISEAQRHVHGLCRSKPAGRKGFRKAIEADFAAVRHCLARVARERRLTT